MRKCKKVLSVLLMFVMCLTTVLTCVGGDAGLLKANAAAKSVKVKTQKELNVALKDSKVKNITITSNNKKLKVPKGNYSKKNLTVKKSSNTTIVNAGKFNSVNVADAKVFTEEAKGNTITSKDKNLKINVKKSAKDVKIASSKASAELIINVAGDVSDFSITGKNSKTTLNVKGSVSTVNVTGDIRISGSTSTTIDVFISSGVLVASTALNVKDAKDAEITFNKGSEGSTVNYLSDSDSVRVINDSSKDISVIGDKTGTISAGKTETIKDAVENKTVSGNTTVGNVVGSNTGDGAGGGVSSGGRSGGSSGGSSAGSSGGNSGGSSNGKSGGSSGGSSNGSSGDNSNGSSESKTSNGDNTTSENSASENGAGNGNNSVSGNSSGDKGNSGTENTTGSKALSVEEKQVLLNTLAQNYMVSGDCILLGTCEQDNNSDNGKEQIEWEVLGENDNGVLLLSKYILYFTQYNEDDTSVTWETSSLRNSCFEFFNDNFAPGSRLRTNEVTLKNVDLVNDRGIREKEENDTQDMMFCLSYDEICDYFRLSSDGYNQALMASPTESAKARLRAPYNYISRVISEADYMEKYSGYGYDSDCIGREVCPWLLRTVFHGGAVQAKAIDGDGCSGLLASVNGSYLCGVRPALYINKSGFNGNAGNADTNITGSKALCDVEKQMIMKELADKYTISGNYVLLGSYEQDGNEENGLESIEWEVIGVDDNSVLVVSRYVLDYKPYFKTIEGEVQGNSWGTSFLRTWLNETFINTAFSQEDQARINPTFLTENIHTGDTEEQNYTEDRIFCLSIDEIFNYYKFNNYDEIHNYSRKMKTFRGGDCQELMVEPAEYLKDLYYFYTYDEVDYYDNFSGYGYTPDCIGKPVCSWWVRDIVFLDSKSNAWVEQVLQSGQIGICDDPDEDVHGGSAGWVSVPGGVRPAMYLKK